VAWGDTRHDVKVRPWRTPRKRWLGVTCVVMRRLINDRNPRGGCWVTVVAWGDMYRWGHQQR